MTIEWTPERTNALMALWDEGHSTAEIGRRLGVTKNSVVGKVHRLGLPKRGSPIHKERTHTPRTASPSPRPAAAPTVAAVAAPRPVHQLPPPVPQISRPRPPAEVIKLGALTSEMCSWPIGDPGTEGFQFCGHTAVPGKPYCAEHCAIAYVKVSRDRDRDRERDRERKDTEAA